MIRGDHSEQHARPSGVRTSEDARTGARLSNARAEGRRAASRLLRAASAVCSLRRVAETLGVSPSRVEDLADEAHPAAVALGDLLVAPAGFAQAVLVGALAEVRRRQIASAELRPEARALRIAAMSGKVAALVADALSDGELDPSEVSELLRALSALGRETEDASRDLAALGSAQ